LQEHQIDEIYSNIHEFTHNKMICGDGNPNFSLAANTALPWSIELIERYVDRWNWFALTEINSLPWSTELIEQFAHRWGWGLNNEYICEVYERSGIFEELDTENLQEHQIDEIYSNIHEFTHNKMICGDGNPNWGCLNFCVRGAEKLVHGGGRRLRRTTDAVGKLVPHLKRQPW
jgi:hypothetical protein